MNTSVRQDLPLRIAINAQFLPGGGAGGVESVLIGLVHALGQLNDGPEEYFIIGPWQNPGWMKPYLGPNQRIVSGPEPPQRASNLTSRALGLLNRKLGGFISRHIAGAGRVWPEVSESRWLVSPGSQILWREVPMSDGFYENLGCNVIHFPWQPFVVCALPSIYNPHDLQHLHYPQFFTPQILAWRETIYPAGCHFAHTVVAGSQWVKHDIIEHYHVSPGKIQVIPWAPPTQAYTEPSPELLNEVKEKYRLDMPFCLYPSVTWEHKNHIRLLESLALLRDREGLALNLICTGTQYPQFWPLIEMRIQELNLNQQVRFAGHVPPEDLRVLYRLAQFVVVPTLFEAASGPVFESWQEGTPVACSTVTSLPEQAGDATLLFDPLSVEAIAQAIAQMATNGDLREELQRRGARRLQDFSWERTAKAYRAVYRRAAGQPLSEEDQWILSWDWMREPQKRKETHP